MVVSERGRKYHRGQSPLLSMHCLRLMQSDSTELTPRRSTAKASDTPIVPPFIFEFKNYLKFYVRYFSGYVRTRRRKLRLGANCAWVQIAPRRK